jgi:hypothetical protein
MCCALMLALVIVTVAVAHAQPTPVTTCGQQVTTRRAELTGDLDCTGSGVDAITMTNGGRLDLNGFTLTADGGLHNGVVCNRACKVAGPGTITAASHGVFLFASSGRVIVDGVTIDNSHTAVFGPKAAVRNSTLTGNEYGVGINTLTSLVVRDSVVTGNDARGVYGHGIRIVDSDVTGNGGACPPLEQICCDLVSATQPRVRGTSTCGTSCANSQGAPTWGVCAND